MKILIIALLLSGCVSAPISDYDAATAVCQSGLDRLHITLDRPLALCQDGTAVHF